MRIHAKVPVALAIATLVAGCPEPQVQAPAGVELKITSATPDTIFSEGGELVELVTENGCAPDKASLQIGEVAVASIGGEPDRYSFLAPASTTLGASSTVRLTLTCNEPPAGKTYAQGKNTASIAFTYDPELEPAPQVVDKAPVGDRQSVLAKVRVQFSRRMDPASISPQTVFIQGVEGTVEYIDATRTATFTPAQQLAYRDDAGAGSYTVVVKGGAGGVRSLKGRSLQVRSGSGSDETWQFSTRREGEGNPWTGDISAAAGISTGGQYKLFSVTGQPTPVGEAQGGQFKVQSGFIYATQTGSDAE